jgi:hypothetical protein
MTSTKIEDALRSASTAVLETMFFSDVADAEEGQTVQEDAIACILHCNGAENGTFTVAIDPPALQVLCAAFCGLEDEPSLIEQREMICELTNMLAGSTLSAYAPDRFSTLSSPQLCGIEQHAKLAQLAGQQDHLASVSLLVEGGLLTVSCSLRAAA